MTKSVQVRVANRDDIPALVDLNHISYPTLAEDNVTWAAYHLASHQRIFPQGQLLAECDGKIVGGAASLIVNMGSDPLRPHTWAGVTDSGYFTNHDPQGDTLYGADVFVHPDYRRCGVGAALYAARRDLCKRLNLRRILTGGRMVGYHEHADDLAAMEYAQRVANQQISDNVLSFQLRQGFVLRGVMPNFLRDPLSKNYATLLEWLNPEYRQKKEGPRKVRIACVQYAMHKVHNFEDFARQVSYCVHIASEYRSDFVMFPEFFTVQLMSQMQIVSPQEGMKRLAELTPQIRELLVQLAMTNGITIIGGSTPIKTGPGDRMENACHVVLPDGSVHLQSKLHITPHERRWWGISGGRSVNVIDSPTCRIGVAICYDVEFPELARDLADQGIELLFVPFCTDNRQGYLRVRYCAAARAIENQIYVALTGNVGNLPDTEAMDIQYGQAACLTPSDFPFARDGVAAEADSNEETVLICDVDLDDLVEARHSGTVTPRLDRRSDLFPFTSSLHPHVSHRSDKANRPLGDQKGYVEVNIAGTTPT